MAGNPVIETIQMGDPKDRAHKSANLMKEHSRTIIEGVKIRR